MKRKVQETDVISFRVSREILDQLDHLAKGEMRSRGNLIMVLLDRLLGAKKVFIRDLEWLVKTINEQEAKKTNSTLTEYYRGKLAKTKDTVALLYGEREKDRLLDQLRKRTGLPIPHIVPLDEDGSRYGFDRDAG